MLKQASVRQVRNQEIPRENSLIVIAMCFYPRGIKKEWRDDFRHILAPDRALFSEWKQIEKEFGHDEAFERTMYEARFHLTPTAMYLLKMYSDESLNKDIYLVCQCELGERCHREMLLQIAQQKYGAVVDKIYHQYPVFEARIPELDDKLKMWGSP